MKTLLLTLIVAIPGVSLPLWAQTEEPFPPTPIPLERYETMRQRSPFVLPTADEEIVVETTWASDYEIVSLLRLGEEQVVFAKKLSTNERIRIREEANEQGIRLVRLQSAPDPRDVSAVLEMGGVEGTIRYSPEILTGLPQPVSHGNPALITE